MDLWFRTATELLDAIRSRRLSSRELLDVCLRRIEQHNPALNAVVTLDAERAMAEAARADDELVRGQLWGPLHGLPMTVKDALETAGMRTTCGMPQFADHVPDRDADAVALLRAAGAIVFGKTNTPLAAGDFQTYNEIFGTTNNPWDLARTPGGSSGGAAAAVAAGLTPLELGSDLGGSIRNPAHYCGVYGLKPTFGVTSTRGHIPGPPGMLARTDVAVVGPIARSAGDLDLVLDVIAAPTRAEATAWRIELPPPRRAQLGDYRLAAWLNEPSAPVDSSVRACIGDAITELRSAGVRVDEDARPGFAFADAVSVYERLTNPIPSPAFPDDAFAGLAAEAAALAPEDQSTHARWLRNMTQPHRSWLIADEERQRLRALWAEFFERYDALLCPAAPTVAFQHDHNPDLDARKVIVDGQPRQSVEIGAWAGFVGACYLPAAVAPIGLTPEGLPVGVQIVAPYLDDRTVVDVARRLTELVGGYGPPPGF